MDKQQAAKKYAWDDHATSGMLTRTEAEIAAFIAGVDWQAQSSTDAVAFAYWMANNNVKILQAHPDVWTYGDAYKLFNPSGAAPRPLTERMVKALEQVRDFSTGKLGSKYLGCIISDCNVALEEYYKSDKTALAPQAAGPVWVKASVRYPKKGIHCAGKYKGKHYDIIVDDLDNILVSGTLFLSNKILQEWYPGIEWLDESGAKVFTREQVEGTIVDAMKYAGTWPSLEGAKEWLNLNYPETK